MEVSKGVVDQSSKGSAETDTPTKEQFQVKKAAGGKSWTIDLCRKHRCGSNTEKYILLRVEECSFASCSLWISPSVGDWHGTKH
jgi:hypothetical protein